MRPRAVMAVLAVAGGLVACGGGTTSGRPAAAPDSQRAAARPSAGSSTSEDEPVPEPVPTMMLGPPFEAWQCTQDLRGEQGMIVTNVLEGTIPPDWHEEAPRIYRLPGPDGEDVRVSFSIGVEAIRLTRAQAIEHAMRAKDFDLRRWRLEGVPTIEHTIEKRGLIHHVVWIPSAPREGADPGAPPRAALYDFAATHLGNVEVTLEASPGAAEAARCAVLELLDSLEMRVQTWAE